MKELVQIRPQDTVAVALQPLAAGTVCDWGGGTVTLRTDIPMGHKAALRDIRKGEAVIKYGFPIGEATEDIPAGAHVHTHNLHTLLSGEKEYSWNPTFPKQEKQPAKTFQGYRRKNGRPGIRNELWIIPTVGCVNDVAKALARDAQRLAGGSIDGVYAFPHPYGCSQLEDDQDNTRKVLAALATHPNAGGVLVLGLGCENNGIDGMRQILGDHDPRRIRFLNAQDCGDEVAQGVRIVRELQQIAAADRRQSVPVTKLKLGLKCGGSDGFSGLTANPLVGRIADRVAAMGGSAVLTEVPEMFGAERILMDRCVSRDVFDKTVKLINGYKAYFIAHGQPVSENPSPGNKAGGITTLEEKSLGCVQKGGSAPVTAVLDYGDFVAAPGLSLLNGPGNDAVAVTNLTAAGCQIILFTTGRGTPLGAPVPTVKIATNTALFEKKPHWLDCDAMRCGTDELWAQILRIAGGERTKNERNGDREIAIFKDGVTL